jgi:hypothetical protein
MAQYNVVGTHYKKIAVILLLQLFLIESINGETNQKYENYQNKLAIHK